MFSDGNLFLKFKVNWISNFLLKIGFDEKYFCFQKLKTENWIFNFHFENRISIDDLCFDIQNLIGELDIKLN